MLNLSACPALEEFALWVKVTASPSGAADALSPTIDTLTRLLDRLPRARLKQLTLHIADHDASEGALRAAHVAAFRALDAALAAPRFPRLERVVLFLRSVVGAARPPQPAALNPLLNSQWEKFVVDAQRFLPDLAVRGLLRGAAL